MLGCNISTLVTVIRPVSSFVSRRCFANYIKQKKALRLQRQYLLYYKTIQGNGTSSFFFFDFLFFNNLFFLFLKIIYILSHSNNNYDEKSVRKVS